MRPLEADLAHMQQVVRIKRFTTRLDGSKETLGIRFFGTSLKPADANVARLAVLCRGHWGIEEHHHVRDTTYDEDRSQVRSDHEPQVMASLRNLAIALLRLAKVKTIAQATRWCQRRATRAMRLIGL